MKPLFVTTLSSLFFAFSAQGALHYPDALTSRLEHLLVDTDGVFKGRFKDAITPCSNYVSGEQTLGRQTSAQWLRVAFHDFVTAHVDDGSGGIDASIGFETLRAEDSGSAFNDSFAYWAPFVDSQTSMADLLALGTVTSLGNCGGLIVPYRGGRIDATSAGPFGVPEPETNLEETLAEFANAGFNVADAIGLTACGHSLGRVHHGGFPQVVPESAVTPNNTAGGIDLDTTRTNFDINIVEEYLGGYGQKGGPLVTSDNVTVRSDLRLYESDGNATMRTLAQSKEYFSTECNSLFERMINTVPKEVKLSDVIQPIAVKPVNVSFDISVENDLPVFTLSGYIRYLQPLSAAPAPSSISISTDFNHTATAFPLPSTGSSIHGTTTFYHFNLTLSLSSPASPSLPSTLQVSSPSFPTQSYPLSPQTFFVLSLSTLAGAGNGASAKVIVAHFHGDSSSSVGDSRSLTRFMRAKRQQQGSAGDAALTAQVSYPTPQAGTLAPRIERVDVELRRDDARTTGEGWGGYEIWEGKVRIPAEVDVEMVSVDVVRSGEAGGTVVVDAYNHFR